MKRASVVIRWREGLHFRHAADLVRTAKRFRSTIVLECGGRRADVRSILSVIALCATMGTALDVEAKGEDEQEATLAIEQIFIAPEHVEAHESSHGN